MIDPKSNKAAAAQATANLEEYLNRKVRPALAAHGGGVTLLSFADGVAVVRLTGACTSCPSAGETFTLLIRESLLEHPAVLEVRLEPADDTEMLNLARRLLKNKRGEISNELERILQESSTDGD